ncbi:MAG: hypothetical protein SFV81_18855 [Pirellulaceae bacterium]|nr:hypothetical protein [Pirellulaceae bacterium]
MLNFRVLNESDFMREYRFACAPVKVEGEEDELKFARLVWNAQGAIADKLKKNWQEVDDYEIGSDYTHHYHVCGGIYSDRIVCGDYIRLVAEALAALDTPDLWVFHTSCETPSFDGQFFIWKSTVYIEDDSKGKLLARLSTA